MTTHERKYKLLKERITKFKLLSCQDRSEMLSKKDLILARKTYEANKLKFESKNGSRAVYTPAGSTRPRPGTGLVRSSAKNFDMTGVISMNMSAGSENLGERRPSTSSMTMTSPIARNKKVGGSGRPQSRQESARGEHNLSGEKLVAELGRRGLTGPMKLKKQLMKVSEGIHQKIGKLDYTNPEVLEEALSVEDFYMPKVTKKLPNGATLMDVYRSKQNDTWAMILKSQLADENRKKVQEKLDSIEADKRYGIQLREQLVDNEVRRSAHDNTDDELAALVEETSKKADDVQKARKAAAVERHKTFIRNALEDIETKRIRREAELNKEIEAAVKTNNRVKALIEEDKQKVELKKIAEGKRLEALWNENQAELKRKADIKRADGIENLKIFREGERRMKAEDERRKADLESKMRMSLEGPAHRMHDQVTKAFLVQQDEWTKRNMQAVNCLNKQLQSTEEFALARKNAKGLNLEAEMQARQTKKDKEEREEYERMRKIQEYNLKKKREMEKEDEKKLAAKRAAAMRYQRELDQQLAMTRQRSMDSMRKTMSANEVKMNNEMLRALGVTVET